mmetsp:Transcript_36029/g.40528  ORF Transcript_36029/g.40528 Transcript_36029/m.40528 type:complete len:418 (-) Transcript_36029:547-1800(-)
MIFPKQATLFLVSTFGILSVADGGSGTRTKRGLKSSKGSKSHSGPPGPGPMEPPNLIDRKSGDFFPKDNPCADSNPETPNAQCFVDGVVDAMVGPQAGINITEGYEGGYTAFGDFDGDIVEPITTSYLEANLCPVNIHWHSGAEHFSAGEFDCTSRDCSPNNRPTGGRQLSKYGLLQDEDVNTDETHRELDEDDPPRDGFRCNFYDKQDHRFTDTYDFKYCKKMTVGETYEVHWPHGSATGAGTGGFAQCGTPNQYQSPFYRGLFCNFQEIGISFPSIVNPDGGVTRQFVAENFAVQGQVFTIINDEDYYYPDLFRGMIRGVKGKDYGKDMAVYIGSSSESRRNNEICSSYTPITWQVDRKCHLISASSFDKLCADMLSQSPTDMTEDVEPAGARELVADALADPRVETLDQTPWNN